MNKNRLLLIVTFLILGLLVAACGGGAAEPTEAPVEEPTEAPAEEPTEEPMEEPTEAPMEEEDEEMAEANSIVDIAVEDGRFTTLVAAVQAAGLAETLSGDGAFTVFAPTDDAFAALPEGTVESLLEEPEGALKDILLYHVAEGAVPAETVVTLESATTIQGEPVTIEVVDGEVILNGSATVIITDIEASNGIIHVIDAVLLPPSIAAAPAEDEMAFETTSVAAEDCDYGGKISSVESLDELTVQFNLCKPDPAFLAKIAFTPFNIQPQEWIEETGGTGDLLRQPIGTGPYMVEDWVQGDQVIYRAFADYWGEPAAAETAVLRWNQEGAARLVELQSGNVDYITNVSPDDIQGVVDNPDLTLIPVDNPNILYLAMTNTFEPWDNPDVRMAIAMGIDRQRLVDNFYPEGSEVASHFTPCTIPGGCEGEPWYDFDPEAARQLLADAGYPDGFETSIFYRDVFRVYLPEPSLVAVDFQEQLRENLGIEAEIVVMESAEFIAESTDGNLDGLYLLGWGADYPHVTNFLDFHFSQQNPQFGDPHPEIYEVLEQASQIADPVEAASLYEEANNQIKSLIPMVPIAHGGANNAALVSVEGAYSPPFGAEQFYKMDPGKDTFIFMQNNEPISLYCPDETDGESLRPCQQVTEGLLEYADDSGDVVPELATECVGNEDATVWTCTLREGVMFHNGSVLDANDVVFTWAVGIDAANPLHVGNTGGYDYYSYLWDGLINAPSE